MDLFYLFLKLLVKKHTQNFSIQFKIMTMTAEKISEKMSYCTTAFLKEISFHVRES